MASTLCRNILSSRTLGFAVKKNIRLASTLLNVKMEDQVAVVEMARAPVNGLNLDLVSELLTTFQDLEKNKCRGMVLTSALPTIFSGGLDIMEMYKPNEERAREFWTKLQDMWLQLYSFKSPTAAAINGHSPAGGCLMASSCEYRVMVSGKYTIGLNETKLGIVAPKWFMDPFRNLLSNRKAELALTTGKLFTVPEALEAGLIDDVAENSEEAVKKSLDFIANFSNISPEARAATKISFRQDTIKWLKENKQQDLQTFINFIKSPQVQQGLELYLELLKKKASKA